MRTTGLWMCFGLLLAADGLGCGDDGLGECKIDDEAEDAEEEAEGNRDDGRQVLSKCITCHSSDATGDARQGAPAGLDFDTAGDRREWAEAMWEEIDSGRMPPPAPAGTGELSSADKQTMRAWLACGADDPAPGGGDWSSIWTEISANRCLGCHQAGSPVTDAIGGGAGFDDSDPCSVLDNLLGVAPVDTDNSECAGGPNYIVANDADGSLLVQKLKGEAGVCGVPMPQGGVFDNDKLFERLVTWINAGATAPECQ